MSDLAVVVFDEREDDAIEEYIPFPVRSICRRCGGRKCSLTMEPPEVENSRGCWCIDSDEEQRAKANVSIFDGTAPINVVSMSHPLGSTSVVVFAF